MGLSGRTPTDAHSRRPLGFAVPAARLALIRLACRDHAGAKHEDATFRGLTARFSGRDDLQHSLRYAVNCSMLFIEAPWLEPHGSEVRDRTPPREPVCRAARVKERCSVAAGCELLTNLLSNRLTRVGV
jgi:hypothetical protein